MTAALCRCGLPKDRAHHLACNDCMAKVPADLRNTLGIAVGKLAHRAYRELLDSPRWLRLANFGAKSANRISTAFLSRNAANARLFASTDGAVACNHFW